MKPTAKSKPSDKSNAVPSNRDAAGSNPQLVLVHFEFNDPTALTVAVAGNFNNWHPTTRSMQPVGSGVWVKEAFLPPGDYEYCLVVDGQWRPDPRAQKSVANPFGGRNSILNVARSPEAAHRVAAQNLPLKTTNKQTNPKL